jgi:hypothetical protein
MNESAEDGSLRLPSSMEEDRYNGLVMPALKDALSNSAVESPTT